MAASHIPVPPTLRRAWQWDGTREGGKAIATAIGRALMVLHDQDTEKKPRFLEVPGAAVYASPGDWIVRADSGAIFVVEAEVFTAVRAAKPFPAGMEGTPS